jgi:dTMP kinase
VFITFEGVDRSGKTTQARMLADALGERALLVREPGGSDVAERIRDLVKDPAIELSPVAETMLFMAARADLVTKVLRPALEAGKIVICDRFGDSTVAYQGAARDLGIDRIEDLNWWVTGGLVPDMTFLLDLPLPSAETRAGSPDRFEKEGLGLQRGVTAAYDELAERHVGRFVRIDGDRLAETVHKNVLDEVRKRLDAR